MTRTPGNSLSHTHTPPTRAGLPEQLVHSEIRKGDAGVADHLWLYSFKVPVERRRSHAGGLETKKTTPLCPLPHRHSVADKLTLGLGSSSPPRGSECWAGVGILAMTQVS